MKKLTAFIAATVFFWAFSVSSYGAEPSLSAKSAVLVSADTGEVLYTLNENEAMPPASITKIMTLLLTMEAIESGVVFYDDIVTASARAKEMGGSTIFLDEGEKMSVRDLLKGICVASANDASVAVAEFISGSERAFVERMNTRAKELGMENTHFVNTNGLDAEGHVSSAYDIALMSRELMRYEDIFNFTTIWTDSLRDGKFELANTNKLIRFYEGATGLKTGSTSAAGCCISATAERDGMSLIAVIMNAPDSKSRFADARNLLDYGFSKYTLWSFDDTASVLGTVSVEKGTERMVRAVIKEPCRALTQKSKKGSVEIKVTLPESIEAPVSKGDVLGEVVFLSDGETIASGSLVSDITVERLGFKDAFCRFLKYLSVGSV